MLFRSLFMLFMPLMHAYMDLEGFFKGKGHIGLLYMVFNMALIPLCAFVVLECALCFSSPSMCFLIVLY